MAIKKNIHQMSRAIGMLSEGIQAHVEGQKNWHAYVRVAQSILAEIEQK